MTGSEILTLFAQIIGEEGDSPLDQTFALQLMNIAKDKVEELTDFEYLKKKVSLTTSTLPANFREFIKLTSNAVPVPLRPFEDYEMYNDGYYIDYANSTINAIGSYTTTPIMTYKYQTDDLTTSTSPVFPARFHSLLAYEMAFIYQAGIDGDDLNFRMSQIHLTQREELKKLLLNWDAQIKQKNMNDITDYDPRYLPNISDNLRPIDQ
jgi:hypothetical protein